MATPRTAFRPDIEGLRAVAVVLVVLNHLLAVPAGGFIGVDMFFVISGFVITCLLWRQTGARTFKFREFFTRRVRRLLPSGLLVLFATNLAAQYFFLGPRVEQTQTDTWWALAFLANVHMAKTDTDYFHANDAPSLLQHYWSLAVEEQFYIVWPLVVVALAVLARRRFGRKLVLPIAVALTGASFVYALHLVSVDPAQAYFSAPARAWELGAGAVLGLVVAKGLQVPGWLQHSFAWMGVGLVGVAALLIDPTLPFPGATALIPVGASVALVLAGTGTGRPHVTRFLSHQVSRYIGQISYPIYLWHWPVIVISEEVWGRNALVWVAAPFVSVVLAVLTHHLVEDPLRGRVKPRQAYRELVLMLRGNGLHRWRPLQNGVLALFAYVTVLTAIAVSSTPSVRATVLPPAIANGASGSKTPVRPSVDVSPGQILLTREIEDSLRLTTWPQDLDPSIDRLEKSAAPEWIERGCLDVGPANMARCKFGPAGARRHAVVMGDSIAISYLPGLRVAFEGAGWDFQVLTLRMCNNATSVSHAGRPYPECDLHRQWAIQQVRDIQPDLVFMSNVTNIEGILPDSIVDNRFTTWSRGLESTLRAVATSAERVVVLSPPPTMGNLASCKTNRSSPEKCVTKVSASWDHMSAAEAQAANHAGATYIRTDSWFCFYGACPAVINSIPVTFDGIHLTARFSERLGPLIRASLADRTS